MFRRFGIVRTFLLSFKFQVPLLSRSTTSTASCRAPSAQSDGARTHPRCGRPPCPVALRIQTPDTSKKVSKLEDWVSTLPWILASDGRVWGCGGLRRETMTSVLDNLSQVCQGTRRQKVLACRVCADPIYTVCRRHTRRSSRGRRSAMSRVGRHCATLRCAASPKGGRGLTQPVVCAFD